MSECRLCLEIGASTCIFDESKSLSEKIQDCCGFTTMFDDGLPDQICFYCEMKLNSFIEFKEECMKNRIILRERYKEIVGEITEMKNSTHIYDRNDISVSPDIYDGVDEKYTLEDIKPQISEATQFNCLSKDTSNELISNFIMSECRLCLQYGLSTHIFDKSKFLPEKIMDFCGIMIMQSDVLPKQICVSCEMKLNDYVEFKQTCERNYIILKERQRETTGEIIDSKDFIDIKVEIDKSHSFNSDLIIDEKYAIENIKMSQEAEAAWNDYLSKDSINKPPIKKKFKCKKCHYITNSNTTLILHMKSIHLNHKFECDTCHRILKNRDSFQRHFKLHINNGENKFRCNNCDYKTNKKSNFNYHIKSVHMNKTFQCDHCHKILKYKGSLQEHLKLHMNEKQYHCNKCDFKTNHKYNFKVHFDCIHLNKTFKCDTCNKALKSINGYKNHIRLHTKNVEKKYQCDICDYKTHFKTTLIQHNESKHSNKRFQCDTCHKFLKTRGSFTQHLKLHMNGNKTNQKRKNIQRIDGSPLNLTYQCDICHKILKSKGVYERHLKLHIKDDYQCDKCYYKTNHKSSFVEHVESVHLNKTYECDTCHNILKSRSSFRKHFKQHLNNVKKYRCDKCDYKTHTKNAFIQHIDSVHLIKSFECDMCHKILLNKLSFIQHVKRHMDEKRYQCDKCNYKTHYKRRFMQHIENVHSNKTFECDTCHMILNSRGLFWQHLQLHKNKNRS